MFEVTASASTKEALHKARAERSAALFWLVKVIFGPRVDATEFPLGGAALTGSSR
jgi:hypothetical protein